MGIGIASYIVVVSCDDIKRGGNQERYFATKQSNYYIYKKMTSHVNGQ